MPELQESHADDHGRASSASNALCEGFCPASGEVTWARTDWESPVGFFKNLKVQSRRVVVRDVTLDWVKVEFPRIRLAHKAALLLLQGQALSAILIPNHVLRLPSPDGAYMDYTAGHVLLRCNPWDYTLPVPELTGVVIAKLGEIPDGISSAEVLAALAHDSAA